MQISSSQWELPIFDWHLSLCIQFLMILPLGCYLQFKCKCIAKCSISIFSRFYNYCWRAKLRFLFDMNISFFFDFLSRRDVTLHVTFDRFHLASFSIRDFQLDLPVNRLKLDPAWKPRVTSLTSRRHQLWVCLYFLISLLFTLTEIRKLGARFSVNSLWSNQLHCIYTEWKGSTLSAVWLLFFAFVAITHTYNPR